MALICLILIMLPPLLFVEICFPCVFSDTQCILEEHKEILNAVYTIKSLFSAVIVNIGKGRFDAAGFKVPADPGAAVNADKRRSLALWNKLGALECALPALIEFVFAVCHLF